jgi:hypothetical protein
MSALITTAFVPNNLPIIQLTIFSANNSQTLYPCNIDSALAVLSALGINEIEHDEVTYSGLAA